MVIGLCSIWVLEEHFGKFEQQEVLSALPENLPFDAGDYLATIATRFRNQHIGDTVSASAVMGLLPPTSNLIEETKIRVLNGGHTLNRTLTFCLWFMGCSGVGFETFDQAFVEQTS